MVKENQDANSLAMLLTLHAKNTAAFDGLNCVKTHGVDAKTGSFLNLTAMQFRWLRK